MSRIYLFIFSCFWLFFSLAINAQSSKIDLLDQRDDILKDIALTNKLIGAAQKNRGNTINSLRLINKKIGNRKYLILNYKAEIDVVEREIINKKLRINQLSFELQKQKELYSDIIRYSYKNHNFYTKAVYLLASTSINQFYMRKKYFDQLNAARKKKILLIDSIKNQISLEIRELNLGKIDLGDALLNVKIENKKLFKVKNIRENVLSNLSTEEKSLKKQLLDKKKVEKEIGKRIEELILAETKKSSFARLTPEEQLESEDFERNRGKLPWPTRQGIITEKFGEHYHPVIKGVKTRNNGIDISTLEDSQVRTIFSGEVSKIFVIKGSNYTVIIRHGTFYSVYHNLQSVDVNVGDKIAIKTVLGYVAKNNLNNNSILHFEIWKGLEKLNPEDWISN